MASQGGYRASTRQAQRSRLSNQTRRAFATTAQCRVSGLQLECGRLFAFCPLFWRACPLPSIQLTTRFLACAASTRCARLHLQSCFAHPYIPSSLRTTVIHPVVVSFPPSSPHSSSSINTRISNTTQYTYTRRQARPRDPRILHTIHRQHG